MPQVTNAPVLDRAEPDSGWVAEFERALCRRPDVDLRAFLPAPTTPAFVPTLVELVRIDIERRWERGTPKPVEEYLEKYPELLGTDSLAALAFEEYRARVRANKPVPPDADRDLLTTMRQSVQPLARGRDTLDEWMESLSGDANEAVSELRNADPVSVTEWEKGIASLPAVGDTFLRFRLVEELGRGAFGSVYLAIQAELGGRPVALKVGTGLFPESQTLAQLQHTNVVPIYSLHRSRHLQAVCMPFFGRTTLAHVLTDIRGQAVFPSSGHALVSTLQLHGASTTPERSDTITTPVPRSVAPKVSEEPGPAAKALLARLSYPDAVVWVGAQLAAGLAHAHERGIVHRDLKPANVLLTDDGVPMILDFNLAEDTKLRRHAGAAAVGGTLPYMSPEQLASFSDEPCSVDARSDLYSLGVVLFELLTGWRPFADTGRGPMKVVVAKMLEARLAGAPSARSVNPAVPHGVEAIIRKCLAPNPFDRYATARDLQEDLERHLNHQPLKHVRVRSWKERLRKWAVRHPRLSSSTSVAGIALVLITLLTLSAGYARERNRTYRAAEIYRQHGTEFRAVQTFLDDRNRSLPALDEGLGNCRSLLGRYGVAEDGTDDDWEKTASVRYLSESERHGLREDLGEVFYLMARVAYQKAAGTDDPVVRAECVSQAMEWNKRAEELTGGRIPRALLEQQADLARLVDERAVENDFRERATKTAPEAARDLYLLGCWYAQLGRHKDALPVLRKATQIDPELFSAWFVRGTCHLALEQNEMAALCFGSCVALNKRFAPAWLNRGLAYNRLRFFDQAIEDYDRALHLDPKLTEAHLQRSRAKEALGDLRGAIADLTAALETGAAPTRVYFFRANLRDRVGDRKGAAADRTEGLKQTPADELSWVARAENKLDKPADALDDVEQALRLNPSCIFAMQLKAHILAERLNRPADAIPVLDRAIEFSPDYVPARAGRGVLLARAGKRASAIRDAEDALLRDTKGPNLYQMACIYALTSREEAADRLKALELLRSGLRSGFGLDLVDTDVDLDPIRKDPAFERIVAEARALHRSAPR
jgi:serine/threonine protein kinase/Tfp pilus assembly protein PilF